jgi:hypothetical protein
VTQRRSKVSIVLVASLTIAGAIAAPRAQDQAPAVSVDRVRAALERPPSKLVLTERKPDFKVEVVWHHRFYELFETPPWATPPVGWQPPAVGFNLLSVFQSIAKSASDAKHASDERAAREEVQRAIADYCAAQPEAFSAARICGSAK